MDAVQEEIMNMYNNDADGIKYNVYKIKKLYSKILNKTKCDFLFYDILKQVKELPPTIENIDTFIARAYEHNYTDAKILLSMFRSIFSSEEKIVSLENKGSNKIGNKIVMCNQCVKIRGNSVFDSFLRGHPELIKNTQKQMNIIMEEILAKKLDGNFRFYPLIIAYRLNEVTKGTIKLNLVNYCKIISEDSNLRIQNLKNKLENYLNNSKEKEVLITQYPALKNELIREINRINSKIEKIQAQIDTELNLQTHINNYLESYKA